MRDYSQFEREPVLMLTTGRLRNALKPRSYFEHVPLKSLKMSAPGASPFMRACAYYYASSAEH
jgi:hypothetical protein